ncbi:hypothetical protein [Mucilaginibacter dorajii]|uniref:Uncharacterized protein n=1 Tax=Mucilaginibacter dorajii TaxID=692994 RepID=A0ABP7QJZ2_9SPHI|nr:hypothetical protein [Mucilaginibacter dorajii]MCS3734109.1 hypothetical protein [Mucilaginibacter dorajii]
MLRIKSITIPTPCHEVWHAMQLVDSGRYCQSCCKTVTDFTTMTNTEIINYFSYHTNVCGKFAPFQLNSLNQQLVQNRKNMVFWKRIGVVAAMIVFIPFARANAQKKHKTEQAPVKFNHRDTLKVSVKGLGATDIKIQPALPEIKNGDLTQMDGRLLLGTVGGIVASGTYTSTIRSNVTQVYTSVYDMLIGN